MSHFTCGKKKPKKELERRKARDKCKIRRSQVKDSRASKRLFDARTSAEKKSSKSRRVEGASGAPKADKAEHLYVCTYIL